VVPRIRDAEYGLVAHANGRTLGQRDEFVIHPEIPLIAKLFVNVPDTKIWLTNPAPGGNLGQI
jgi:hypothetical protein